LINPYFIYALSFLAVLVAYLFKWSNLFPDLGLPLLSFLICSIIIALFIGKSFMRQKIITFNKVDYKKHFEWITTAILIGYIIEFIYHRNFPLLAILSKTPLSYVEFGIPTFHVLLVTFNSFFSIYLFQSILSDTKRRGKLIFLFVLTLIPSLLIINRGMLIIILVNCVFVYLIKNQYKITLRKITGLSIIVLVSMYIFGVAGNVRVNNSYQTDTSLLDNSLFLQIGGATDEFKESIVPKEFFWAYTYAASPLANLQKTIDQFELKDDVNPYDSFVFATTQILPDFISKRIVSAYEIIIPDSIKITPELNVSTSLAQPYLILGWVGISLFTIFIFVFAFVYILLLKKMNSEYFVVGVVLINSIFVLNTFDNMFSFTGLSFQLVYPILLSLFGFKKITPRAVNNENNYNNSDL
jgi:oligosaccharide repeat unit polymerase